MHPQDEEAAACGWGGAGSEGWEGWLVGFSIFVCVHFHIFTVCGMRQPHEAKTINCNKLRPTPCKEHARAEQGEGERERRLACNKCSPTSVGNVCLAHATLCCMQMRHVAPLLMPCNIVATSQREAANRAAIECPLWPEGYVTNGGGLWGNCRRELRGAER